MPPIQPRTPREVKIAKGFSSATWMKAMRVLRRIAAGLDPRVTRELDTQFAGVAEDLMHDLANEVAVKGRRAARREHKLDGKVHRSGAVHLDNGWTIKHKVPKVRRFVRSRP